MEGVVDAAALSVTAIVRICVNDTTCREELLRVARFSAKLGLLLTEVRLSMLSDEDLRGSKAVFLAADGAAAALRQAEQLVEQCAASAPSSIWPLEDAVRFQAVAAELCRAAGEVAALGERLPRDVLEDAAHVHRQAALLSFTQAELSETEEQELERVQHHNSLSPDPSPSAAQAASHTAPDPVLQVAPEPTPAVVAAAEAGAAPPAAPLSQFTSPAAALASGAAVASHEEATRAAAPPDTTAACEEAEQRHALQSAAAVAVESAAEVLSGSEGEPGGLQQEEERGSEVAAEEAEALERELREDARACQDTRGVVVTRGGDTALPPQSPAKGAVPTQGGAPLPPDPFDMSGAAAGAALLGPSLPQLHLGARGPEEVGTDVERQLDSVGHLIQGEHGQGSSPGSYEAQALAGLRQLPGLDAAGAGAAAAGAAAQVAGSAGQDASVLKEQMGDEQAAEGTPASAAARPQPALHSHALADSP